MTNKPLVSILIPYYNDKKFLATSIEAVLNQTYSNFELILLNHATTDSCREIAHSYKDSRIKHIDMPYNLGYGGSGLLLKEFLKIAKGKYVKLLCADDIIRKDGLQTLVNYMETNPEKDFAFGNMQLINEKGKDLNVNWFDTREKFSINNDEIDCLRLYSKGISSLPYPGNIIKRKILNDININVTYIMMFDMSLWAGLLCKGYKIGFCSDIVLDYRIHSNQLSTSDKYDWCKKISGYEWSSFWKVFLEIKDINFIKQLWPDNEYIKYLDNINDIPFIVYTASFKVYGIHVYPYIEELLNNDKTREYYEKKFHYTIKTLREDCISTFSNKEKGFKAFKRKIYMKNIKDLDIMELSFLFMRQFFGMITLEKLRKRKQKRYTA